MSYKYLRAGLGYLKKQQAGRARAALLGAVASSLLFGACGGGGGGDSALTPAPVAPAAQGAPTYADCMSSPAVGTVDTLVGTSRQQREWVRREFLGETVDAVVTTNSDLYQVAAEGQVEVRYFKRDAATGAATALGLEVFGSAGELIRREQYLGLTALPNLSPGQSQQVDYTVKVLFPAAEADRPERLRRTYEGNQWVNLKGGRLETCRVSEARFSLAAGTVAELSTEQRNHGRGTGPVKTYLTHSAPASRFHGLTFLTEWASSTAPVALSAAPADAAPSLADCSTPLQNRALLFSARHGATLVQRVARTEPGLLLVETTETGLENAGDRDYFDASVGLLRLTGRSEFGKGLAVVTSTYMEIQGVPDLRGLAIGASTSYPVKHVRPRLLPPGNFLETATFLGHQKVTTPAGTFDACKVRFVDVDTDAAPGAPGQEATYYFVPHLFWVRKETPDSVEELLSAAR